MYILTDGKNYVMENPMQIGQYISTTSPVQAKEFTFKQARSLLNNKKKSLSWVRKFYMLNQDSGEKCKTAKNYKGNGGVYTGENAVEFDDDILSLIYKETKDIIGLAGWSMSQLNTYEEMLRIGLSKYDSAESDVEHVLQEYEEKYGKKPQAHKAAKIAYLLAEIRGKHKHLKQCLRYIKVMEDAITYNYTLEKIKLELVKKDSDYEGRTEYYDIALEILE